MSPHSPRTFNSTTIVRQTSTPTRRTSGWITRQCRSATSSWIGTSSAPWTSNSPARVLRRVESGGDLLVGYQAGISQEKEFDSLGAGGWGGPFGWGNWGNTRVTTSTIDIGKLTIGLFDPASKQLVWRGAASKTLNISKDPDKNYRNLEKALAKLFRNYPPGTASGRRR